MIKTTRKKPDYAITIICLYFLFKLNKVTMTKNLI
jgi:hypothetical protein